MEMFFLGYVNELCIYLRLSFFQSVCLRLRNNLTNQYALLNKPVCFTHANVLLSYVNETMLFLGNPPFSKIYKIYVNRFVVRDDSPCANALKMYVVGEGPGATL